ncbi:MAG: cupredoxin domain-containing protein, partial [Actinomycetota bacterium]
FLAWYDTEHEDALVGEYGEIEGLAIAAPSPEPAAGPTGSQPGGDCTESANGVVEITARGIAFDTSCVNVTAGEPFTIVFANEDEDVPHNVAIYPSADDLANPLFQGEVFPGVDTVEYPAAEPLEAGEYYFQCDVHPPMNGTWNAVEGGDGGGGGATGATGPTDGGGGGGGGAVTVTAQNIEFDTDTIELPADTENTITFDNQDAGVQHNIAIFTDDSLSESLFRGEVITGPDTIDYPIPPLEAGEYYFHCDIHPDMNGTVIVA